MDKHGRLVFRVEKDSHAYEFSAPLGAPFGATHDALYEIVEEVLTMAKERHAQVAKDNAEKNQEPSS